MIEAHFKNVVIFIQIEDPLSVLYHSYCDRSFYKKSCEKSSIKQAAFLNFVPQLIRKIYCGVVT